MVAWTRARLEILSVFGRSTLTRPLPSRRRRDGACGHPCFPGRVIPRWFLGDPDFNCFVVIPRWFLGDPDSGSPRNQRNQRNQVGIHWVYLRTRPVCAILHLRPHATEEQPWYYHRTFKRSLWHWILASAIDLRAAIFIRLATRVFWKKIVRAARLQAL